MKKTILLVLLTALFLSVWADLGALLDLMTVRPANTTSYMGTLGGTLFYEIEEFADVKGLSLRPSVSLGFGTGRVRRDFGVFDRESDLFYTAVIPDVSVLYYFNNLEDFRKAYKKGFNFYVGAGALMTFSFNNYSNDEYFDDEYSNSFPYPALKLGLEYKKNILFEINISSPSMLSFGIRF